MTSYWFGPPVTHHLCMVDQQRWYVKFRIKQTHPRGGVTATSLCEYRKWSNNVQSGTLKIFWLIISFSSYQITTYIYWCHLSCYLGIPVSFCWVSITLYPHQMAKNGQIQQGLDSVKSPTLDGSSMKCPPNNSTYPICCWIYIYIHIHIYIYIYIYIYPWVG